MIVMCRLLSKGNHNTKRVKEAYWLVVGWISDLMNFWRCRLHVETMRFLIELHLLKLLLQGGINRCKLSSFGLLFFHFFDQARILCLQKHRVGL